MAKEHLRSSKTVKEPGHTVISTATELSRFRTVQLAGLLAPCCFPAPGPEGRPVSKFQFFLTESAASPTVYSWPHPLSLLSFDDSFTGA